MKKLFQKLWNNFEVYLMILFLGIFLVNITVQIFLRLFFKSPLSFAEEVSRYSFVWMVFLGLSYATKYNKHIRIDCFVTRLSQKAQEVIELFIDIVTLAVFTWIFFKGIEYVGYSSISRTYALDINKSYVVLILPLSGALMIIRVLEKMKESICALLKH